MSLDAAFKVAATLLSGASKDGFLYVRSAVFVFDVMKQDKKDRQRPTSKEIIYGMFFGMYKYKTPRKGRLCLIAGGAKGIV